MKKRKTVSAANEKSSNCTESEKVITFELLKSEVSEMPRNASMSEVKSNFASKDLESLNTRSETYINFLQSYIFNFQNKGSNQQKMKKIFLIWTMILLSAIVLASFACILLICRKSEIGFTDLAAAISAIVGVIVAFIELPKLVARNLFPSSEDDKTKELFSEMFNSDMKIRQLYYKELSKGEESEKTDTISSAFNKLDP